MSLDAETIKKAIRPLEWRFDDFQSIWVADTAFGKYQAWEIAGRAYYRFIPDHAGISVVDAKSVDTGWSSAREAAQADYEARIISALSPEFLSSISTESSRTEAMRKALEPFRDCVVMTDRNRVIVGFETDKIAAQVADALAEYVDASSLREGEGR